MKKFLYLIFTGIIGLSITACGSKPQETVQNQPTVSVTETTPDTEQDMPAAGVYRYVFEEELEGNEVKNYNYLAIKDDNTGVWVAQDKVDISWDSENIKTDSQDIPYEIQDGNILLKEETGETLYEAQAELDLKEFVTYCDDAEYLWSIGPSFDVKNSFVEEQANKTEFESYEEVISYLTSGQAYAYIQIQGYEGDLLAVADTTYEYEPGKNAAMEIYIYAMINNSVQYVTVAWSDGTGRPIAVNDGVLVCATQHDVSGSFFNPDGDGIMTKFYASEEYESGEAHYSGFERETNSFDAENENDDIDEAEYYKLYDFYNAGEPIFFNVVE